MSIRFFLSCFFISPISLTISWLIASGKIAASETTLHALDQSAVWQKSSLQFPRPLDPAYEHRRGEVSVLCLNQSPDIPLLLLFHERVAFLTPLLEEKGGEADVLNSHLKASLLHFPVPSGSAFSSLAGPSSIDSHLEKALFQSHPQQSRFDHAGGVSPPKTRKMYPPLSSPEALLARSNLNDASALLRYFLYPVSLQSSALVHLVLLQVDGALLEAQVTSCPMPTAKWGSVSSNSLIFKSILIKLLINSCLRL